MYVCHILPTWYGAPPSFLLTIVPRGNLQEIYFHDFTFMASQPTPELDAHTTSNFQISLQQVSPRSFALLHLPYARPSSWVVPSCSRGRPPRLIMCKAPPSAFLACLVMLVAGGSAEATRTGGGAAGGARGLVILEKEPLAGVCGNGFSCVQGLAGDCGCCCNIRFWKS